MKEERWGVGIGRLADRPLTGGNAVETTRSLRKKAGVYLE
jgi:hypothetical protein